MLDLNNPLTWPLFPVLPVVRIGRERTHNPNDMGIIGATHRLKVVPIVYVCNLCNVGGRNLADIHDDPGIPREEFADLDALAKVWRPD